MQLVFATNNKHKLDEANRIAATVLGAPDGATVLGASASSDPDGATVLGAPDGATVLGASASSDPDGAPSTLRIIGLRDIGCVEDIPETGDTLMANALQKARYIHQRYGCDCFADDTGLEVDALDGAPGVHSARYAPGVGHDSQANMRLLLHNLEGSTDRSARFRTVIALILDGREYTFEGVVEGRIIDSPRGDEGFGYDPVFVPTGWDKTFAEATADEKNAISHRGRAVRALMAHLKGC